MILFSKKLTFEKPRKPNIRYKKRILQFAVAFYVIFSTDFLTVVLAVLN